MVSKIDMSKPMSEFESHWVSHLYSLVPHISKKISKLQKHCQLGCPGSVMVSKID